MNCKSDSIDCKWIFEILEQEIFEKDLSGIFEKIKDSLDNPEKFQYVSPLHRIMHTTGQSRSIRYGNALEKIISKQITDSGYKKLKINLEIPKDLQQTGKKRNKVKIDHLFKRDGEIFLIEQKLRDNHDSTKKEGQFSNYMLKYNVVSNIYPNEKIHFISYIVDDSFKKNQKFYDDELKLMTVKPGDQKKHIYGEALYSYLKMNNEEWSLFMGCVTDFEKKKIISGLPKYSKEDIKKKFNDFSEKDRIKVKINKLYIALNEPEN